MSEHRRAQLIAGAAVLAGLAALWWLVRWATARPWLAALCVAVVAGVAYRLVLEVPGVGQLVRTSGESAARWLRELIGTFR